MSDFESGEPIILGLSGPSGVGKTATADAIAPLAQLMGNNSVAPIRWKHIFYAMPLYEMASIKKTTRGNAATDRQLYQIYDVLLEVFGSSPLFGAPPFNDLIDMVHQIQRIPISENSKPREFLQKVGTDIVRARDENAWVKLMRRKIHTEHSYFLKEQSDNDYPAEQEEHLGIVISDIRFKNEAEWIYNNPNGLLLKLTADEETRKRRQALRDGYEMTADMHNHKSETSIDLIPEEWYNHIVNTTNMTVKEQVAHTLDLVKDFTGVKVKYAVN